MVGTFGTLDRHLANRKWREAERELFKLINGDVLEVWNYDTWGRYGGAIERGLGRRWEAREKFWKDLGQVVTAAEARTGKVTHKGLIYFKIGAMSLFVGRSLHTSEKWLKRAHQEDMRLFDQNPRPDLLPQNQSAYRILLIVRAFERFWKNTRNPQIRHFISQLITMRGSRIGQYLGAVYDKSLLHERPLPRLTVVPFDKLLGRNNYRALVEQNYRGAEWLCNRKDELQRTNIEQYGVAHGVIGLCGSTIEGILLANPRVRQRVQGNRYTLDSLTISYLSRPRVAPELAVGLFFIWFARNLIHPAVSKDLKQMIIDMNFADFTLTLTGGVIALLAKKTR